MKKWREADSPVSAAKQGAEAKEFIDEGNTNRVNFTHILYGESPYIGVISRPS